MHIVFYGPEGCGKGTQAKLLAEKLNLPILTSGDLVRESAAGDQGLIGDACRRALTQGKYVPDSEMFVLWKQRLKRPDAKRGWIMDGFPRNFEQAKFLDDKIDKYGYKVEFVFYLNLSKDVSFERLIKRARPLHLGNSQLHDSPERICQRLEIYKQGEKDVLDYYKSKGVLVEVNANQSIQAVSRDIMQALRNPAR